MMNEEDADKQQKKAPGRPFLKGVSGNPKGRPKKEHTLTSCVRELLDGDANKVKEKWKKSGKMTGAQMTAIAIVAKLSKGDAAVLKEVWNRTEGRVPMPVEHTGKDGGPVEYKNVSELVKKVGDGSNG